MRFVVTAFGPFGGMPFNPTMAIVLGKGSEHSGIVDFLSQHALTAEDGDEVIVETLELPVSASGVVSSLQSLYSSADRFPPGSTTVVLHLGVDGSQAQYSSPRVKLERTAHNCMDFRIPDNDGFQPRQESIEAYCCDSGGGETKSLQSPSSSSKADDAAGGDVWTPTTFAVSSSVLCQTRNSLGGLDSSSPPPSSLAPSSPSPSVDLILSRLGSLWNAPHPLVDVSDDPGRFVCNFCLYHSLMHCATVNNKRAESGSASACGAALAMFVHVPPFELISEALQLRLLRDIMLCCKEIVDGKINEDIKLLGRLH